MIICRLIFSSHYMEEVNIHSDSSPSGEIPPALADDAPFIDMGLDIEDAAIVEMGVHGHR